MDARPGSGRRSPVLWRRASLLALWIAARAYGSDLESPPRFVGPVSPFLRAAVARALADAVSRLDSAECARIFGDFQDASGRPLSTNLTGLRLTARSYLEGVRFADGGHAPVCGDENVFAFTHPGADTIYLCGTRFASLERTNPPLGAALLVHEELHTLGLGENPPLSREITTRVLAACRGPVRRPERERDEAR